jgi:hypothetical protein
MVSPVRDIQSGEAPMNPARTLRSDGLSGLRNDILFALGLSVATVACFFSVLAPVFFFREWHNATSSPLYSISGCHVTDGGRFAAVTYRSASPYSKESPQYFAASVDLLSQEMATREKHRCPPLWLAATAFPGRQLLAIDVEGKVTRRRFFHRNRCGALPALFGRSVPDKLQSIDDRLVVAQADSQLIVCDLEREKLVWRFTENEVTCFTAVPSRKSICILLRNGRLLEVDARTGRPLRDGTQLPNAVSDIAISQDGRKLALAFGVEGLRMYGLPTETGLWTDLHPNRAAIPSYGRLFSLSPQGDLLVTTPVAHSSKLAIWSVATGRPVEEVELTDRPIQGVLFANEYTLIWWGARGVLCRWDFRRGKADVWTPESKSGVLGEWWLPFTESI